MLIKSMTGEEFKEYNFAFMFFNESPNSSGYPRQAFISITTEIEKDALLARIASWHILNDKGNNAATAEAFYEAWLWFRASASTSATRRSPRTTGRVHRRYPRTTYVSPGVGCAKNHIIYLANGFPQDNNTKVAGAAEAARSVGDAVQDSAERGRRQQRRGQLGR